MIVEAAGFMSPYWMTYRQCQKLGGHVGKGEKSTIAIFYKSYDKLVERDDHSIPSIGTLHLSNVMNLS